MANNRNMNQKAFALQHSLVRELAYMKKFPSSTDEFRYMLMKSPSFSDQKNVGSIPEESLGILLSLYRDKSSSSKEKYSRKDLMISAALETPNKCVWPAEEPSSDEDPAVPHLPVAPKKLSVQVAIKLEPSSNEEFLDPGKHCDQVPCSSRNSKKQHTIPSRCSIQKPNSTASASFGPNNPTQTRSGRKRKTSTELAHSAPTPRPVSTKYNVKTSVDDFFCDICEVNCSSNSTLNQHLMGRLHNAKLKWIQENSSTCEHSRCDLCQIQCTGDGSLELHFKGKQHLSKVNLLERANSGEDVTISKPIRCELCGIICMNDDGFEQHLVGKKHVFREEMKRRQLI